MTRRTVKPDALFFWQLSRPLAPGSKPVEVPTKKEALRRGRIAAKRLDEVIDVSQVFYPGNTRQPLLTGVYLQFTIDPDGHVSYV